jgi:hypothetical protein
MRLFIGGQPAGASTSTSERSERSAA